MPSETDLYNKLSADADVTDIVNNKIWADVPDEEVSPPFIYYERISTQMVNTIHTGIPIAQISQFSVECISETREEAELLGDRAYIATATDNTFVYIGRTGDYDPETRLYVAAIQLQHNQ